MHTILKFLAVPTLLMLAAGLATAAGDRPAKAKPAQGYSVYHDDGEPVVYDDPHANAAFADINSLTRYLLDVASRNSKYQRVHALPMITRISRAELEQRGCPGTSRHCQISALYESERGVMIAEDLQPETNIFHRSILFHELVHYLQDVELELLTAAPCERWYQREVEAYALQNRFLSQVSSPARVSYAGARPSCEPADSAAQTHRAKEVKAPGVNE